MKRRLLKLPALLVCALAFMVSGCGKTEPVKVSETNFAMDTFIKIDAYSAEPGAARLAVDDAMQAFQTVAVETDRFNDGGPGSLFDANQHAAVQSVKVAPHLAQLLTWLEQQSEPRFDITLAPVSDLWQQHREQKTVPAQDELNAALTHTGRDKYHFDAATQSLTYSDPATRLDLGAVAKGYAVDVAAATLKKHSGLECALINAGGNIKAVGNKPGNVPWRVAVQHPRQADSYLGTLLLTDGQAAATSGDYQRYYEVDGVRYHHILDVQNGQPVRLHQSVTVLAPSAVAADYHSTLFFVLPTDEIQKRLAADSSLAVVIVEADGSIFVSGNLQKIWQPAEAS